MFDAGDSRKEIADPALAKEAKRIAAEVTKTTREGARLPASWTLSTPRELWIPEPVQPYDSAKRIEIETFYHTAFENALTSYAGQTTPPLNSKQIERIVNAYESGSVPSDIADHFTAISKIATEEVQKKYGLPNTWFRGTDNVENLKPINLGIVTTAAVNHARAEFILDNSEELMNSISAAMQRVIAKMPSDDPIPMIGKDYETIIATAIRELKAILRDIQIRDAEKSKETQIARSDSQSYARKLWTTISPSKKKCRKSRLKRNKSASS